MRNAIASMLVALLLLGAALPLLVLDASGTRWEQTSADDFADGESFFIETSGGTLTLAKSPAGVWRALGESSSDLFGASVASAGDVNGDGYGDVIIGAYGAPGPGNTTGEAYVYYGSATGLASSAAWNVNGEAASDYFGTSVASAGDVNGDGYADVVVGANGNDGAGTSAGEAYVYHGSASGLSTTPDWSKKGEAAYDGFGYSVASAGDVNGDGYSDVVVGANGNDGAYTDAGKAYVYHGSASGLSSTPDWSYKGEAQYDYFGVSVASAGDVNGDGYTDVIVGAYRNNGDAGSDAGKAYVYHGSASGLSTTLDWSDEGEAVNNDFGWSVASAGDVNGDGYADVIVGAKYNDGAGTYAGEAYVYHGSASGLSATPDWSDEGEAAGDYFGWSVASAGDVNGDGYADVVIGANFNDDTGSNAGEAYVYHGSASGLSATPDWSDQGEAVNDQFGKGVASAGDVNGDGYADVIVGAAANDDGGSNAGAAYVYSIGASAAVNAWAQQALTGATTSYFGVSVASAGDVNGDGYGDVIVGAYQDASGTGKTYVYHGSASGIGSTAAQTLTGENSGDYFGWSVASAGDVNGDGYDDVIIGAYEYDSSDDEGRAYIYHGSSSGIGSSAARTLTGAGTDYFFGRSVASAGDVNGDGYADVIIGAEKYSTYTGRAYVYHGGSSGISASVSSILTGEATGDNFGHSVASAGDVNGDGYADVIVGADYNDGGESNNVGEAYVYQGSGNGIITTAIWSDQGEAAYNYFGESVASAGDVNGDGYGDVIVGAHRNDGAGKAYVYHGSASGLSASPDWSDQGEAKDDYFGSSVAPAGDVNGDGYADVIVGANDNDGAGSNAGEAYVYHGSASGLSASPDWSDQGETVASYFGYSVAGAGDVDGDGYADVIIGAHGYSSSTGRAYIYHSSGYVERGVFESRTFNLADGAYDGVDWISLAWTPTKPQPAGTTVKAQVGTSSDGRSWTWHGPTGSTSSYFTNPAGQAIYAGDRDQFLKVRFYLTSDFSEPGDARGDGAGVRTPSVESFTLEYTPFHKPAIQLTWPNGGENLMHSEKYAVTWTASGDMKNSTPVNLEYSLNGGSSWSNIATGIANDGHHLWTVPENQNIERALIRITATALDGSTVQDTSDGTFSIDPPEFWQTGDGETIDTEPPVITLFALPEAIAGEPLTVRAEVSDETAVTQVALRYTAADGEPVTIAMSPAGNGVWEVVLLPAEGNLELAVIASDGTNVVETPSQSLTVGAAGGTGTAASGSSMALVVLVAAALGLLAGLSRRRE